MLMLLTQYANKNKKKIEKLKMLDLSGVVFVNYQGRNCKIAILLH